MASCQLLKYVMYSVLLCYHLIYYKKNTKYQGIVANYYSEKLYVLLLKMLTAFRM